MGRRRRGRVRSRAVSRIDFLLKPELAALSTGQRVNCMSASLPPPLLFSVIIWETALVQALQNVLQKP